jgi:parallel beta-helix repeat protein
MIKKTNLTTWLIISVFLAGFAPALAVGGTIYVDVNTPDNNDGSSWAKAYKYLQDALAVAGSGDQIWVAEGTYKPDANSSNANIGTPHSGSIEDLVTGLTDPTGIALDVAAGKMYWTDYGTGKIQRANMSDGSGVQDLVTGYATGIALDVAAGKMYWTDLGAGMILRANMSDGSGVQGLVTGLDTPSDIALDVAAGKMYWTDNGTNKIQRANMSDGSGVQDLVTGLTLPYGIALDVAAGKMYWTDYGTHKIQRANMSDGSGVQDLVTGLSSPYGIALDVAVGKMYWTDAGTDKIQRANMSDGSGIEDLVTGLVTPMGIALDVAGGKMYWTDAGAGADKIQRSDMFAGGSGLRTESFELISGLGLYGGFAGTETTLNERDWVNNETILSGDINEPGVLTIDNSYHVVIGADNASIDGFTIERGQAGGSAPNNKGGGMYNDSSSPTVSNCTFSTNGASYGGGMCSAGNSSPTVSNCTFSTNSAGSGGGMCNAGNSSPTVTNCSFSENTGGDGGGMYNDAGGPTVTNCTFIGNYASYGGGMYNNVSGSPTVTNCTFTENSADMLNGAGGVYNAMDSYPTLTNCILWHNSCPATPAMWAQLRTRPTLTVDYCCVQDLEGDLGGTGNIGDDPLFVDPNGLDGYPGTADDDLRLSGGSPCIDAGDNTAVPADTADLDNDGNTTERTPLDLEGEGRFNDDLQTADTGVADPPDYPEVVDMGAYEYRAIIYVDANAGGGNNGSNWNDAYKYVQDALADAAAKSEVLEIRVAEGIYRPDANSSYPGGTNERVATFQLINGVAIYGGFPSGGGDWESRDPYTYETILSGDIGTVDVNTDNSYHVVTGSYTEPNAVLDGFTITAGYASGAGSHGYGGGMYNRNCNPTVNNCTFSGNWANNDGGAMDNYDNGSPTLNNCTFSGNEAGYNGGGLCNYGSNPMVTNCAFSGNRANSSAGGMYNVNSSSPTVTNCTFSGNNAVQNGGGMGNYNSSTSLLTNCILWGNTASSGAQIYNDGTSSATLSYSDVQGGWGGTSNISDDPMFKDADGADDVAGTKDDDLSLSFNSPCIDAGDNNSVPADTADLDNDENTSERTPLDLAGNARFTDDPYVDDTGNSAGYPEIVEIGAYERYEFCGDSGHPFPVGDVSGPHGRRDCRVDFFDFAAVAAHWLEDSQPE